ncbi:MAG: hypothetical protein K0R98_1469 [Rickettsiaceae bacterium]|jgi:hypothetical protein|nr:hypothetical protein [Rickettsiaceae bacterium]
MSKGQVYYKITLGEFSDKSENSKLAKLPEQFKVASSYNALDLTAVSASSADLKSIIDNKYLDKCPALSSIKLDKNRIDYQGAKYFLENMPSSITEVTFAGNQQIKKEEMPLLDKQQADRKLFLQDLQKAELAKKGIIKITKDEYLATNGAIFAEVAGSFKEGSHFHTLDLSSIEFGDVDIKNIFDKKFLNNYPSLHNINLNKNKFTDLSLGTLIDYVKSNPNIKSVSVIGNSVSNSKVGELTEALFKNNKTPSGKQNNGYTPRRAHTLNTSPKNSTPDSATDRRNKSMHNFRITQKGELSPKTEQKGDFSPYLPRVTSGNGALAAAASANGNATPNIVITDEDRSTFMKEGHGVSSAQILDYSDHSADDLLAGLGVTDIEALTNAAHDEINAHHWHTVADIDNLTDDQLLGGFSPATNTVITSMREKIGIKPTKSIRQLLENIIEGKEPEAAQPKYDFKHKDLKIEDLKNKPAEGRKELLTKLSNYLADEHCITESLSIISQGLKDNELKILNEGLSKNKSLTKIDLRGNLLGKSEISSKRGTETVITQNDSISLFAKAIGKNKSCKVSEIELSNNFLQQPDVDRLTAMAVLSPSLKEIHINGIYTELDTSALDEVFKYRNTIVEQAKKIEQATKNIKEHATTIAELKNGMAKLQFDSEKKEPQAQQKIAAEKEVTPVQTNGHKAIKKRKLKVEDRASSNRENRLAADEDIPAPTPKSVDKSHDSSESTIWRNKVKAEQSSTVVSKSVADNQSVPDNDSKQINKKTHPFVTPFFYNNVLSENEKFKLKFKEFAKSIKKGFPVEEQHKIYTDLKKIINDAGATKFNYIKGFESSGSKITKISFKNSDHTILINSKMNPDGTELSKLTIKTTTGELTDIGNPVIIILGLPDTINGINGMIVSIGSDVNIFPKVKKLEWKVDTLNHADKILLEKDQKKIRD